MHTSKLTILIDRCDPACKTCDKLTFDGRTQLPDNPTLLWRNSIGCSSCPAGYHAVARNYDGDEKTIKLDCVLGQKDDADAVVDGGSSDWGFVWTRY